MLNSFLNTYNRYKTLRTGRISALPVVIIMPHSSCNCRCVMCDIWKDNKNLKQLTENDIIGLLATLKKFRTKQVVMSGGEALLNKNFFRFCEILQDNGMRICLLSTGLTLEKNAEQLVKYVNQVIVSLDGDEIVHDKIRNIDGAFSKLKNGIEAVRAVDKNFKISGRTVIHKMNFGNWSHIIDTAKMLGLQSISFLPADVSSQAFNRETPWDEIRQSDVIIDKENLPELEKTISHIVKNYAAEFSSGFIAESPEKIYKIYTYYSALHGLNDFPEKKCNAPWVSTVVEADGNVRPCFFHDIIGNIGQNSLENILNSKEVIAYRKNLDMDNNETCKKCVCYLNLHPRVNPV